MSSQDYSLESVNSRNSESGGGAAYKNISSKKKNRGRSVRKRPVSFGNPALGTYHGNIYTLEGSTAGTTTSDDDQQQQQQQQNHHPPTLVEGAVQCGDNNLVAMVDVPPEQVPEGILNLARSHRPWINHVRIVIAEQQPSQLDDDDDDNEQDNNNNESEEKYDEVEESSSDKNQDKGLIISVAASTSHDNSESYGLVNNISAAENAALILAEEQNDLQQQSSEEDQQTAKNALSLHATNESNDHHRQHERSYVVLLELCSAEATQELIQDLHRKPYTSLDETQVCSIYPVVALQGQDGVSLQSPFFASSSSAQQPAATGSTTNTGNNCATATTSTATAATGVVRQPCCVQQQTQNGSNEKSTPLTTISSSNSSQQPPMHHVHNAHQHHHHPHQEDYNCPVCLERMDLDLNDTNDKDAQQGNATTATTSILTTVCNHSFHLDCLLQWQDSPCPVCRFDHSGLNEALSQCHVCGTTENNYVCLICGVVSCGGSTAATNTSASARASSSGNRSDPNVARCGESEHSSRIDAACGNDRDGTNSNTLYPPDSVGDVTDTAEGQLLSHARQHYDETLHAYALDTHTQHVWDFCGQGYVHRLLQNKEDGKLVEVADPNNTTSQERSLNPGLSEAQEGEVVHRKLEGMASAYYTLLKSQLEQQRIFYEGRLEEIRRESRSTRARKKKAPDLIAALKQERHQLSQRLVQLQSRRNKVKEDTTFLINMNESLEKNKDSFRNQVTQAQQQRQEVRRMFEECLPPLQEKVTRLMLQLESELSSSSAQPAVAPDSSKKLPGNRK